MAVRNCKKCNKIFESYGYPLCPQCLEKERDEFRIVKDYLWDNPGATIHQVSEATGVAPEKILRYIREERIEVIQKDGYIFLDCERCGTAIKTGRYCEKCALEVEKLLLKEARDNKNKTDSLSQEKGKMHLVRVNKNRGRNR